MSSAEATVDDTVVRSTTVRSTDATHAATVLTLIAVSQLTWLAALVYGANLLLT